MVAAFAAQKTGRQTEKMGFRKASFPRLPEWKRSFLLRNAMHNSGICYSGILTQKPRERTAAFCRTRDSCTQTGKNVQR